MVKPKIVPPLFSKDFMFIKKFSICSKLRISSSTKDNDIESTFVDNSNPHYFPSLLEQHKDVNKAKMLCYDFCLDCKNCENTCVQNCTIDAAAVETYKKIDNTDNPKSDKRDKSGKSDKSKHKKNYKRTNPISFYTAFVIFLILFIFLIYNFLTYIL